MRKVHLLVATAWLLSACAPGPRLETLSEVEASEGPLAGTDAAVAAALASPEELARPEGGLFAAIFGRRGQPTDPGAGAGQADIAKPEAVAAPAGLVEPEKGSGLFGIGGGGARAAAPRTGPDRADVAVGTRLPFGTIARVCDVPRRMMGDRVERFPERGRGFALYDSAPGSTAPRTFYVTGFSDGCARQFTAALAMFGSPSMHEQLRYGRPSEQYPYSDTDKAYEAIKSKICRVGRRKPCGARISELERTTAFISIYERFPTAGEWKDILLHDGEVLALAVKQP